MDEADRDPRGSQARSLLGSIEQSLETLRGIGSEIQRRFEEDLASSKKVESDLLTEANMRNNLERHRLLFNSVVDQLKQAQFASGFGGVTARTLDPPGVAPLRPRAALIISLRSHSASVWVPWPPSRPTSWMCDSGHWLRYSGYLTSRCSE